MVWSTVYSKHGLQSIWFIVYIDKDAVSFVVNMVYSLQYYYMVSSLY